VKKPYKVTYIYFFELCTEFIFIIRIDLKQSYVIFLITNSDLNTLLHRYKMIVRMWHRILGTCTSSNQDTKFVQASRLKNQNDKKNKNIK